ncbi:MAG: hypothetical protein ACR2MT_05515 [Aurantibacter sp.]
MPLYLDSFKNNLPIGCTHEVNLKGLEPFKNDLEKCFFSSAIVRKSNSEPTKTDLIIELECNFSLNDAASHFREEIFNESGNTTTDLSKMVAALQEKNNIPIDIEEFSLHLLDTTIIIQRIYEKSIHEQWNNIFREMIHQYGNLTIKLRETPFEIYLPVFEENWLNNHSYLGSNKNGLISSKDYFTYWGLYFDSEEDAVIYDVKNASFIFEDIYMLNK